MEGQTPSEVVLVFVHFAPGSYELPGYGVFGNGDRVSFPDQAAADAAYETGWFAPPGGVSKRGLSAKEVTE